MDLYVRSNALLVPGSEPNPHFAHIENLPLIHEGQHKLIRNPISSTNRTISLLPWAMALDALSGTRTNKTSHRITVIFFIVRFRSFPADFKVW